MNDSETQIEPKQKKQSSEISGTKAVAFVAIMLTVDIAGAVMANNPAASTGIFKASFFLAVSMWAISKMLPAGWLNLPRTALLSLVLFGGVVGFVLLGR